MFSLKAKQKRFSLYFLEENEIYTQDLTGYCLILDNNTQKEKYFFKKKLAKKFSEKKKGKFTFVLEALFLSQTMRWFQYQNIFIVI